MAAQNSSKHQSVLVRKMGRVVAVGWLFLLGLPREPQVNVLTPGKTASLKGAVCIPARERCRRSLAYGNLGSARLAAPTKAPHPLPEPRSPGSIGCALRISEVAP